ncbi:RDD family protein [bacterium LRH843]|nr:RDD family protein [bacterium LRH843]
MKIRRILSMGIDMAFIILFEMLFFSLIGEKLFDNTFVSVGIAYFIGITLLAYLQSKWDGQTIGKRIVKLKVVADKEGHMSFWKYWARLIIAYILIVFSAGIIFIVNLFMIIIRKDQKTIQDFIVHSHVDSGKLAQ